MTTTLEPCWDRLATTNTATLDPRRTCGRQIMKNSTWKVNNGHINEINPISLPSLNLKASFLLFTFPSRLGVFQTEGGGGGGEGGRWDAKPEKNKPNLESGIISTNLLTSAVPFFIHLQWCEIVSAGCCRMDMGDSRRAVVCWFNFDTQEKSNVGKWNKKNFVCLWSPQSIYICCGSIKPRFHLQKNSIIIHSTLSIVLSIT